MTADSVARPRSSEPSVPDRGERFVCSWSGGKDSCLALHRAVSHGGLPAGLMTMLIEAGGRTRNHGLATAVIEAQAASLNIPLVAVASPWSEYERRGENGEYHTVVTSGPLFRWPLDLIPRKAVLRDGYWFLDFQLRE